MNRKGKSLAPLIIILIITAPIVSFVINLLNSPSLQAFSLDVLHQT